MSWTEVLVALIAAGLLKYAVDLCKWLVSRQRTAPRNPYNMTIATVDQSLAVVARARDELEGDNLLLRAALAEERASRAKEVAELLSRHANDREIWHLEKTQLKAEISDLERRLRELLTEVENLRLRTG